MNKLLISCIFFIPFIVSAQNTSWSILDGLGINPIQNTNSSSANYEYTNPIDNTFYFNGIMLPDEQTSTVNPSNLHFFIFASGEYYLDSIFEPRRSDDPPLEATAYRFINQTGSTVVSARQINKYEGDDPNEDVSAANSTSYNPNNIPDIELEATNMAPGVNMGATNDAVPDDDVTIIVRRDAECADQGSTMLCYDIYRFPSEAPTYHNGLFSLSPIFNQTHAIYPTPTSVSNPETRTIYGHQMTCIDITFPSSPSTPYFFVNFRTTNSFAHLFETPPTAVQQAPEAFFTSFCGPYNEETGRMKEVENNNTAFGNTQVAMLSAHDPNFIQLTDITGDNHTGHWAHYHVEFQNTGNESTNEVRVEIEFPSCIDVESGLHITSWKIGAADVQGSSQSNHLAASSAEIIQNPGTLNYSIQNNLVQIAFPSSNLYELHEYDASMANDEIHKSIGYFNIAVKINPVCDISSAYLRPTIPYTTFEDDSFHITTYLDFTENCAYGRSITTNNSSTNRYPTIDCDRRPNYIKENNHGVTCCCNTCVLWVITGLLILILLTLLFTRRRHRHQSHK